MRREDVQQGKSDPCSAQALWTAGLVSELPLRTIDIDMPLKEWSSTFTAFTFLSRLTKEVADILVRDGSMLKAPVRQPRRRLSRSNSPQPVSLISELLGAKTNSEVVIRGHLINDQTRSTSRRLVPLQLSLDL
jgi:hypothetical protein